MKNWQPRPALQKKVSNPDRINQILATLSPAARISKKALSVTRPPNSPKKPRAPYLRFSNSAWPRIKKESPNATFVEIGEKIGKQWRNCSQEIKQQLIKEYNIDKEEYLKTLKVYHASEEYLKWQNDNLRNDQASTAKLANANVLVQGEGGVAEGCDRVHADESQKQDESPFKPLNQMCRDLSRDVIPANNLTTLFGSCSNSTGKLEDMWALPCESHEWPFAPPTDDILKPERSKLASQTAAQNILSDGNPLNFGNKLYQFVIVPKPSCGLTSTGAVGLHSATLAENYVPKTLEPDGKHCCVPSCDCSQNKLTNRGTDFVSFSTAHLMDKHCRSLTPPAVDEHLLSFLHWIHQCSRTDLLTFLSQHPHDSVKIYVCGRHFGEQVQNMKLLPESGAPIFKAAKTLCEVSCVEMKPSPGPTPSTVMEGIEGHVLDANQSEAMIRVRLSACEIVSPTEHLWNGLLEEKIIVQLPESWKQIINRDTQVITFYRTSSSLAPEEKSLEFDRQVTFGSNLCPEIKLGGVLFQIHPSKHFSTQIISVRNLEELLASVNVW